MTTRDQPPFFLPRRLGLTLALISSGWVACGKTSNSDGPKSNDTSGAGGGGTTAAGGGTSFGSSVTANIATSSVEGSGGFGFTASGGGFSTTGSGGGLVTTGSGGFDTSTTSSQLGCTPHEPQLAACHSLSLSAEGAAGAAGAGGDSGWDWECWVDVPYDCEVSFEGQVLQLGRDVEDAACDAAMFDGGPNLDPQHKQWLVLGNGIRTIHIMVGGLERDLDVDVGDSVTVNLVHQLYQDEFVWGSRMTLTDNGNFLAVLNETIPVTNTQFGFLKLGRGDEVCQRPVDESTCTYFAHDLRVVEDEQGYSVPPYSRAFISLYEIVTEENFVTRGTNGADCDSSSGTNFVMARVKSLL